MRGGHFIDGEYLNEDAARVPVARPSNGVASASFPSGAAYARANVRGAYYQPTILTDVESNNRAVQEEIFGPILTVQTFEAEDEALALAQHAEYGLASSAHTADLGRALRFTRGIEARTVWVNRYGRCDDSVIATGGFKRSGIGKDFGREAFEANQRAKHVLIHVCT